MTTPHRSMKKRCAGLLLAGCALGATAQPGTAPATGTSTGGGAMIGAVPGTTGNSSGAARAAATTSAKLSGGDRSFVEHAAAGGMAEVQLGKLAGQKATNDQVKQFGARMVQDHSKANDELMQVASGKGVQVPTALDKKHQKDIDRLQKLNGVEFDRAYMSHMVEDHKKDVSDFKKQADSGKDPELKAFAAKTLPTLQEHLAMAQSTNDLVKGNSKGGRSAGK